MTDPEGGEAAAVETTPQAAPEAALSSQDGAQKNPDIEATARELGWKPESEWKGEKPAKFYSAEEWVDRPIAILQKKLKDKDADLDRRLAGIERVNATTIDRLNAAHAKEIEGLKAERKEAVKAADVDEVERLDKAIDKLKDDAPAKPEAKAEPTPLEKGQAFVAANPWYLDEPDMAQFLDHWTEKNGSLNPKLSFEENMAAGVEAVKRKFPARFGATAANRDAAVDAGGSFTAGAGKPNPLSKLPNEARTQCKADRAKYPAMYPTDESWIKAYEG